MKIGIIGYGKMGQEITRICIERNHEVITFDPLHPSADHQEVITENIKQLDVGIEFTNPDNVLKNIKTFNEAKIPLVIGTTGWYENIPAIEKETLSAKNSVIYASNFAIGVNVFFKIIEQAAKIVNKFPDFDISAIDIHHNQKVDSPSGTAMTTAQLLVDNIERKNSANYDKLDRAPRSDEIHFASLRAGSYPGAHQVIFDSPAESISIEINARNRSGYALGAVIAAEWIISQQGFYSFENLIDQILND